MNRIQSIFFIALFFICIFAYLSLDEASFSKLDDVQVAVIPAPCELSDEVCQINFSDDSRLEIQMTPPIVKPLVPVRLLLSSQGMDGKSLDSLLLRFEGRDMDMGIHFLNRTNLTNQDLVQQNDSGRREYKGMIPVCSVDPTMQWVLVLELEKDDERYSIRWNINSSVH